MTFSTPSRKTIGLALGGGVARGPAHVGVLAALVEADIPIDLVAGSSAGALVGAIYCAGKSTQASLDLAFGMGWTKMARPAARTPCPKTASSRPAQTL